MIQSRKRASRKRSTGRAARRRRTLEALEPRQLLASLAGEVWSDLNSNGVREASEPAAANVAVYIDADESGRYEPGEPVTETNVLGQYVFDRVSAGTHVVRLNVGEAVTQTSPRAYFGTGYPALGAAQTQLFEMSESGDVQLIGQPNNIRIHDLIRTNDGVFYGVNAFNDAIYTIDDSTGEVTLLSDPGVDIEFGLAYNPATDRMYTVGRPDPITNVRRLYEVDPLDGSLTQLGQGLTGLTGISDLTFDSVNTRVVGFDNDDDQFFAFDLLGNGTSLSTADQALDSWSLAFNGESFVMFDQADPERTAVLQVNPDTGAVQPAFDASAPTPTEGLFYATSGNVAQRVRVLDEDIFGVDFGVFGESDDGPGGTGPTLGGLFINELLIDPLFGDTDTDQYVEIRGDSGALIPDNTYLVITDDDGNALDRGGEIEGIFDLGNQVLGSNGFLVLLQQDSPFPADGDATVLRSTNTGFSGLPGNIYSDVFDSTEIGDILASHTYFLIQSDVPPVLGSDIDVDDDGLADSDGVVADWNIFDSISMHSAFGGTRPAYGDIVFIEGNDAVVTQPGTEVVRTDGFGYAGRIGDSITNTADDWVVSTATNELFGSSALRYALTRYTFGLPTELSLKGRDLDHVGDSNFVGGVRGHVVFDAPEGDIPDPAPGVTVFADVNGNGQIDNLQYVVDPDDFLAGTELTNAFPGVTIDAGEIRAVTSEQQTNLGRILPNRIFAEGGIYWFNEDDALRFDFYEPANAVSVVGIASNSTLTPTYARLEAYDADGNLLDTVLSNPMLNGASQLLSLSFPDDIIAYALAYTDDDLVNESGNVVSTTPFGRLDQFSYRQFEQSDVTDADGFFELTNMFPDDYRITYLNNPQNPPLRGAQPVPIVITRYENFVLGPNDLPSAPEFETTLDENTAVGTFVGVIEGSDPSGPVTYSIESDSRGILISPDTGEMVVGPEAVLDFEVDPQIVFQVGVSDLLGATTLVPVTINLNDLNEFPEATTDPFFVAEDTEPGTSIGQIQASDPDTAQGQLLTFDVLGGSGAGIFGVGVNSGIVTLVNGDGIDFERDEQLEMIVEISDNGDPSLSITITQIINVVDSNDQPTITTTSIDVDENTSGEIGKIEVVDPDSLQTHQFILVGGDASGVLNVFSDGTVVVEDGAVLDAETKQTYTLQVTVVDSGAPPLSDTAVIQVNVNGINEPPTLSPTSATVPENSDPGTPVATIVADDPEGDLTNTITLLDEGSAASFDFDSETGELTVAEGANLDFETRRLHELIFRVVDTNGQSEATLTEVVVELTDANDAPSIITERIDVSELAPPGSVVGEIRATDVDAGDDLALEVFGGSAANLFDVDADTGVVTVADGVQLDAETQDGLTLRVRVTDQGGATDEQTVEINLNDVNEPPTFADDMLDVPNAVSGTPFSFTVPEGFVSDPEGGEFRVAVFDTSGSLPDWLTFDSQTGTLSGMPDPTVLGDYELFLRAFEAGPLELFSTLPFQLQAIAGDTPLTNESNRLDVDNNSFVAASDALRILNHISVNGENLDLFFGFVDTNGNGLVTSVDALLVINALTLQQLLEAEEVLVPQEDDHESAVDAVLANLGASSLF